MSLCSGFHDQKSGYWGDVPTSVSGGTDVDLGLLIWNLYITLKYLLHSLCVYSVIPKPGDILVL